MSEQTPRKYGSGVRVFALLTLVSTVCGAALGAMSWRQQESGVDQAVVVASVLACAIVPYVLMRSISHLD